MYPIRKHRSFSKGCLFLLLFFISFTNESEAQKTNPVIFGEIYVGKSVGEIHGISLGGSLNFQPQKFVYSFRLLSTLNATLEFPSFFLLIPVVKQTETAAEPALLIGRRIVKGGTSYNFSGGISYTVFSQKYFSDVTVQERKSRFAGFPFEAGIGFFKPEKSRYRIMGLLPVGRPIAFGRGIGFKFFGNLGKRSYAGVGLTAGIGTFKKY